MAAGNPFALAGAPASKADFRDARACHPHCFTCIGLFCGPWSFADAVWFQVIIARASVMSLSYQAALCLTLATSLICGSCLYVCSGRPGSGRVALVVVLVVNVGVPLLFDRSSAYVTVAMVSFLVTWLQSFKAVAWVAGRGPLASQQWTWPQFLALYSLPIVPTDPQRETTKDAMATPSLLGRWVLKTCITAAVVFGLQLEPPQVVNEILYVFGIYGMLGTVMDGPAGIAFGWLGLSLEPHFRPPWESQSVQQFWGRQWNQAASNALRTTIYDPIYDGAFKRPVAGASQHQRRRRGSAPALGRAALALCTACFVSGVVHEIIMAYVYGATTGGVWLAFFSIQGPLILAERWVLGMLSKAGLKPPKILRIAVTLATLLTLAHFLFFRPAERMGLPRDFAAAMRHAFAALAGMKSS